MNTYLPNLTDEELISHVQSMPAPTELESELVARLMRALDALDDVGTTFAKESPDGIDA